MRRPCSERVLLISGVAAWLVVNLLTASRSPTVWHDEVMFADPALRWVQGKGITSTAWPQAVDTPAVLNGPLHTVILAGWLSVWQTCHGGWGSVLAETSSDGQPQEGDLTHAGAGRSALDLQQLSSPKNLLPSSSLPSSSPPRLDPSPSRPSLGPGAVRSLDYVLAAVAALWLWALAVRYGLVRIPWLRLTGVAVFLCGNGVSFSYRSGRYDITGMLVLLGLATCVAREAKRGPSVAKPGQTRALRHQELLASVLLVALGCLLPFAGLHLVPYALLLAGGACCFGSGRLRRPLAYALGGIISGCGSFAFMQWRLGTWGPFLSFVRDHGGGDLGQRLLALPHAFVADVSLVPLVLLLMSALAFGWSPSCGTHGSLVGEAVAPGRIRALRQALANIRRGDFQLSPVVLGLVAGIGIPGCMALGAKFPVYYGWMAFVPTLACVLHWLDRASVVAGREAVIRATPAGLDPVPRGRGPLSAARWPRVQLLALGVLAVAALVGWPERMVVCALEWRQRSYAGVETFIREHVTPADIVYADWQAYYPLLTSAGEVWFDYGARANPERVRDTVSVLVVCPDTLESARRRVGGTWTRVAEYRSDDYGWQVRPGRSRPYWLGVFRRQKGS